MAEAVSRWRAFGAARCWASAVRRAVGRRQDPAAPALPSESFDELSNALARIAELERIIGQQAADLDFFQEALQHVGEAHQQSGAPGGTASTRSSNR